MPPMGGILLLQIEIFADYATRKKEGLCNGPPILCGATATWKVKSGYWPIPVSGDTCSAFCGFPSIRGVTSAPY